MKKILTQEELESHITAINSERNGWRITIKQWEEYSQDLEYIINDISVEISRKMGKLNKPSKESGIKWTGLK